MIFFLVVAMLGYGFFLGTSDKLSLAKRFLLGVLCCALPRQPRQFRLGMLQMCSAGCALRAHPRTPKQEPASRKAADAVAMEPGPGEALLG